MQRRSLTKSQTLAQEFLLSFETTIAKVSSYLNALERVMGIREKVTAVLDAYPMTGSNGDKMGMIVVQTDEAIDKITECMPEVPLRYETLEEFLDIITQRDHDAGLAIRYYYVDRMTYQDIAEQLNVSSSNVYKLLDRGLDVSFEVIAEDIERWK